MTKKTVGYVKLLWTCPRCDTRNPGPNKFCNGCGGPQPEDVKFEQPAEAELIKDSDELARAKAGPDVHCPYCETRNPGGVKFCGACGGDLSGAKARAAGRVVGAHRAPTGKTRPCPTCGTPNPLTALKCSNCGAGLPAETPAAASTAAPAKTAAPGRGKAGLAIGGVVGAICLVAAAAVLILSQRTTDLRAQVESIHWQRVITVEALGPVEHSAWRDELPSDAGNVTCALAYRDTQDDPAPIATEVCGTPYTIDEGSGYGEVVQDCVYQVYDEKCSYTVEEWSAVATASLEGDDPNPVWPNPSLTTSQREGARSETYTVVFTGDGKTLTYNPADAREFGTYAPGSRWTLVVNGLGAIVSLEPVP